MRKLKKIIFPFYDNDSYSFLSEKWWFRLITVFYVLALIIAPFVIWMDYLDQSSGWCYDSLHFYVLDDSYNSRLEACSELARNAWKEGIPLAILFPLVAHYLIQIIIYKLIVGYIVLGGKGKNDNL